MALNKKQKKVDAKIHHKKKKIENQRKNIDVTNIAEVAKLCKTASTHKEIQIHSRIILQCHRRLYAKTLQGSLYIKQQQQQLKLINHTQFEICKNVHIFLLLCLLSCCESEFYYRKNCDESKVKLMA